jgi:hypothetical protein
MRVRFGLILFCAALLVVSGAFPATGIKATLKAPKANPTVDVDWHYSIRVTNRKGRPLKATVTATIKDPFGGVHSVDYGPSQPPKPLRNWPFKGTFRDYLTFPPESRGFTLTVRWLVKAKIGKKIYRAVLTRKVTPQS